MAYTHLFDPPPTYVAPTATAGSSGDQREGRVYVYEDDTILAVNVALATGRPLLIYGPSGSGKSSLARNIAHFKKWRFVERVITSRTQARDLLYEVDLLRRLHDAQAAAAAKEAFSGDYTPYIVPGPLWWAYDRSSARGYAASEPAWDHDHARAVVLLDEIDKADPDVPNNLLVPLGSLQFEVEELRGQLPIKADQANPPLVILTTNEERELPPAFLRRCVELRIKNTRQRLLDIAHAHFPAEAAWVNEIAGLALSPSADAALPSPAEFVDLLKACKTLGQDEWQNIKRIVIRGAAGGAA
jgi:MoxR-like ATPase